MAFALPVAAGILLRLSGLHRQVLGGDEWHAVHAALSPVPLGKLLTSYQQADNCLPLSGWYRVLTLAGVPLTEWVLRAPMLLAGLLLLAGGSWWAARTLGRTTGVAFAWLLALSPFLVWYSRIARSYLPVTLLCGAAAAALWAWLGERRPRFAAGFVLSGALAVWVHPVSGPFLAAALGYAGLERLAGRKRAPSWGALLGVGSSLAAAVALFLIPAAPSLRMLLQTKLRPEFGPGGPALGEVVRLLAGTAHWPLAALFWVAALAGLWILARRQPRLAAFSACVVVGHALGVRLLAPDGYGHPLVLNRYLLPALPVVLLWTAAAAAAAARRLAAAGPVRELAVASLLPALLFLGGPLPRSLASPTSFAHSNDALRFTRMPLLFDPARAPAFYRDGMPSAAFAGGGAVVETPYTTVWNLSRAFPAYQTIHHRPVLAAPSGDRFDDPRLRLRLSPPPRPERLLASGARWVVVHRDVAAEEARVPEQPRRLRPDEAAGLRAESQRILERLRRTWGRPDWRDDEVAVWDLERRRRELARSAAGAAPPQ